MFNNTKLERARKRQSSAQTSEAEAKNKKRRRTIHDIRTCMLYALWKRSIAYIVESSLHAEEPITFRLPDICQLYQQRLEQLGDESPHVNSTRLKDSLLAEIPDLEAHRSDKDGREVTLALLKDVTKALSS